MTKTVAYVNKTMEISCNNVVVKPEHLYCYQPKTKFKGGSIKWFDDSKLIKNNGRI